MCVWGGGGGGGGGGGRTQTRERKKDVHLVELRPLYLHACQVRVTLGDSGLCSCASVTSFEH